MKQTLLNQEQIIHMVVLLVEGLAEHLVRFPAVPIVFCESRPLAQGWT